MNFLKLIRWPNLLLIIATPFIIKYTLLAPFHVPITLNWFGVSLLAIATASIAAAGYIIKAIYNLKADQINQPDHVIIGKHISVKKANKLFFIFNIIGVLIGFYLANIIGHPSFSVLFILASALLYANASSLNKYLLASPLILSILSGLSVTAIAFFDLFPAINTQNGVTVTTFFSIIIDYAILISILCFIRELVLSQLHCDGDHKLKTKSLPLVLGKERTNRVILVLTFIPIACIVYYMTQYLYMHNISLIYALVFLLIPLFFVLIKTVSAKHKKDYKQMNYALSCCIVFSILSLGLYQFILHV